MPTIRIRRSKVLLDEEQLGRTLSRMTHEIAEQAPDLGDLALVGIQRRGVELAARLAGLFETFYASGLLPGPSISRSIGTTSTLGWEGSTSSRRCIPPICPSM